MTATEPTPPAGSPDSRYTVQSVARALSIVDLVAESSIGLTLTEIAKAIGVSKSAAHSLIRTLVDSGYLREPADRPRYQLGTRLLSLGEVALRQIPVGEIARPILTHLSDQLGVTTRVAIADHDQPIFIERVDGPGMVRFQTPIGVRELPHASAAGKAILAHLTDDQVRDVCARLGMPGRTRYTITTPDALIENLELVRRRGFALDDEEDSDGVVCVGASFLNHIGECAGAMSATFLKGGFSTDQILEMGTVVREHADQMSRALGRRV
jgi:IclR family acetate operon transcriptional repressor